MYFYVVISVVPKSCGNKEPRKPTDLVVVCLLSFCDTFCELDVCISWLHHLLFHMGEIWTMVKARNA